MVLVINYVYGEIRKWSLFLGFRSFPKSFYSKTALLLGFKKSWKNKIGVQNFFCHKTFFLSGVNRKFHIDITGDMAVRKQNLIKNAV